MPEPKENKPKCKWEEMSFKPGCNKEHTWHAYPCKTCEKNKPKWEEEFDNKIADIKAFIQEQIDEAYHRGFEDGKNDIFKQNKVTLLTNNNE